MAEITIFIALLAGIGAFLSPCVLPLIPGLIAYLAGTSVSDTSPRARTNNLITAVFFTLGMSAVFMLVGVILSAFLPTMIDGFERTLQIIGGVLIIGFGLLLLNIIRIPFLTQNHTISIPSSYRLPGAFLAGAAFAVGWTPCIGPVLGMIYTLALAEPTIALVLMGTFSLGFSVPFLITGALAHEILSVMKRSGRALHFIRIGLGILLIAAGIGFLTGWINLFSNFLISTRVLGG